MHGFPSLPSAVVLTPAACTLPPAPSWISCGMLSGQGSASSCTGSGSEGACGLSSLSSVKGPVHSPAQAGHSGAALLLLLPQLLFQYACPSSCPTLAQAGCGQL